MRNVAIFAFFILYLFSFLPGYGFGRNQACLSMRLNANVHSSTSPDCNADDDMSLWLRFKKYEDRGSGNAGGESRRARPEAIGIEGLDKESLATLNIALAELQEYWEGFPVTLKLITDTVHPVGYFKVEKCENDMHGNGAADTYQSSGDAYRILITAGSVSGLMYGSYFILRSQAMGDGCLCKTLGNEDYVEQQPAYGHRVIQIDISSLSEHLSLRTFARACASVGINGVVLPGGAYNNSSTEAIKDYLRQYQIEVFDSLEGSSYKIDITQKKSLHLQFNATKWQIPSPQGGGLSILAIADISSLNSQPFAPANWYAFGRKAWNPDATLEGVAYEWLTQTFTENPLFVMPMCDVMMKSSDATSSDIEGFISTWQQMRSHIDADRYSVVESCLMEQLIDSYE